MSLTGTLAEFSPAEIIEIIGSLGKSGSLSLGRGVERGLIVFRHGKIVYAASSEFRENLGSMLLARRLITEIQLVDALGEQTLANEERRLGAILVEMGALSQDDLRQVILEQVVRAISAFRDWTTGDFEFSAVYVKDHGEVELETTELWTPLGYSATQVLQQLTREADEADSPSPEATSVSETLPSPEADLEASEEPTVTAAQEPAETGTLSELVAQVRGPQAKGELIQRLLEQAGESFGRSVVFSAGHHGFRPIAQTGRTLSLPSDGPPLLDLQLGRETPSLLSRCASARTTVVEELQREKGDAALLDALGGPAAGKSVSIPMVVRGETVLILYGDDILEEHRTGWLENLESSVEKAGRAIEADIQEEISSRISAV